MLVLKTKYFILFLLLFTFVFNLESADYNMQVSNNKPLKKDSKTNNLSADANLVLNEMYKFEKKYSSKGDVLIVFSEKMDTNSGDSKKIALKASKEIKKYLYYWFNYWKINLNFLDFNCYETESDKEYVNIVFTEIKGVYNKNFTDRIDNIISKLRNITEVEISKSGRNIKVDLDSFIDINTMEIKSVGFLVLDSIVEIMRYPSNNVGIKVDVYKKVNYNYLTTEKKFFSKITSFLNKMKSFDLNYNIYLLLLPKKNLEKDEMSVIFFKEDLGLKGIASTLGILDENLIRKIDIKQDVKINNLPKKYIYLNGYSDDYFFYPTGWMGDSRDFKVDFNFKEADKECIKIEYIPNGHRGWAGLAWQYPPNNWGNRKKGGIDLRGYKKLVFYAKGEKGNEKISEIKIGGIEGQYADSDSAWIGNLKLTNIWTKYEIDLKGKNLVNIISGLNIILNKYDNKYGCSIYLSDIYFE